MMKVFALHLVLIVGFALPGLSSAQEVNSWLENLKREITKLGIDERGYLHSIGRLRNSVFQDEALFFVSAMRFEELDIQLLPDGNVHVSPARNKISRSVESTEKRGEAGAVAKNCANLPRNSPRLSLVKGSLPSTRMANNLSSRENNLLIYIENFIGSLLLEEENVALSPYFDNGSRYENLMRGGHFEESKHKLQVRVQYDNSQQANKWTVLNPKYLFAGEPKRYQISVELLFIEDNKTINEMRSSFALAHADSNGSRHIKEKPGTSSPNELKELAVNIRSFLSELHCLANYSNLVVAVEGRLVLDSGTDAGFSEGDQLLLMPKSAYFKKRGLLSGVDQIAIARVKKIDALQSELEIEEGKVRLEDGVEFFVRPLLELI